MEKVESSKSLFEYDSQPTIAKVLPISLQHIMAMFVGTVTVPIIVAGASGASDEQKRLLVQFALIMAGIGTLIQLFPIKKVGSKLPIIFSVGFTFVPTLTVIGSQYGLPGIFGAQIIAGVVTVILGLGIKRIRKYFPPVVTGTIILAIGLSLYPIAIKYMAGGVASSTYGELKNWSIAGITLITVIFFSLFMKGYLKLAGILIGVAVGYIVSLFMGMIDFSGMASAGWVTIPIPFQFGIEFHPSAIIAIVLITVVNVMQTVGDISGTTVGGFNREPSTEELSGGVIASGLATLLGSVFGGLPISSYSQNVGIVAMTKVVSRRVVAGAAFLMLALGIFPKFSAFMTTMPSSVIGGATIMVFGMITLTGIKLLKDNLTARNTTIVGLAIALGMGASAVPDALSGFPDVILPYISEPIVVCGVVAFVLNLLVPEKTVQQEEERLAMDH